jgi:hypothetical protein
MRMLAAVPPLALGQLVTIRSHDEELPGTVIELAPLDDARWEVRIEVLASFGIGTSRHIVDGRGHEVVARPRHLALVCAGT